MNALLRTSLLAAAMTATAFIAGCGDDSAAPQADAKAGAAASGKPVVIYSNADEEAQTAIKKALDANGFAGKYLMQTFGTSELGGKLTAEGKNIEADVVTLSSYYLESLQQHQKLFQKLNEAYKTISPAPDYYAPILGLSGALFVNTEVLKEDKLPMPKAIADLAKPEYKGHIAVADIMGSSTAWLMTQALVMSYGEAEGAKIAHLIEANAGPHCEMSGSGPLKKIRAGEVAVGFGLRHQAVFDKAQGLPIDFVDPEEGNFTLYECAAVVDKGDKTNPDAQKVVDVIIKHARADLLKYYPAVIYEGESVDPAHQLGNPKTFSEPLTLELLEKHQKLVNAE